MNPVIGQHLETSLVYHTSKICSLNVIKWLCVKIAYIVMSVHAHSVIICGTVKN